MIDEAAPPDKKTGRNGGFLGGMLGVLAWFNQPADLLNLDGITEWIVMAVFVGGCVVVGTVLERLFAKK